MPGMLTCLIMPNELARRMAHLKASFRQRRPLRTGSLIVTIFGDSIAPRGGRVWLGSLISACELLGIQHRLVRTAVYRLVQDGILVNEAAGRRSFYSLTDAGKQEFADATRRIYFTPGDDWDGRWCIVLTNNLPSEQRASLRKALGWQGFGNFGADVMAHPSPDRNALQHLINRMDADDLLVRLDADIQAPASMTSLQALIAQAWDLGALQRAYAEFLAQFQPLHEDLNSGARLNDTDAFLLRTLLIHEYRKILLRDPCLPRQLMAPTWPGADAYALTSQLYALIVGSAERYLDAHFEDQNGPLPAADAMFSRRFEDLTRSHESNKQTNIGASP